MPDLQTLAIVRVSAPRSIPIGPIEVWWVDASAWDLVGAAAIAAGLVLMAMSLLSRRQDHAVCARCGYDLEVVASAACPECGTALRTCRRPAPSMTTRSMWRLGVGWVLVVVVGLPLLMPSLAVAWRAERRLEASFRALVFDAPPLSGVTQVEIVRPAWAERDQRTGRWVLPVQPSAIPAMFDATMSSLQVIEPIAAPATAVGTATSTRVDERDGASRLTLRLADGRRADLIVSIDNREHRIEIDASASRMTDRIPEPLTIDRLMAWFEELAVEDTRAYHETEPEELFGALVALARRDGTAWNLLRRPVDAPPPDGAALGLLRVEAREYRIDSAVRWPVAVMIGGLGILTVRRRRQAAIGRGIGPDLSAAARDEVDDLSA